MEVTNDNGCSWIKDLSPRTNIKTLKSNENCEWLVIGAGYTGLSAARKLGQLYPNKKIILVMDVGASPNKKFSNNYQSGALSFEIISGGKKLISNSGYFPNKQNKLHKISKSTALQSVLIIDDYSSCNFKEIEKSNSGMQNTAYICRYTVSLSL